MVLIAAVMALWAQQKRPGSAAYPPYEVQMLFPREISPARFEQVSTRDVQAMAEQGWELVSVMPYVYRNEERGDPSLNPRPMVTQTYPAYFFQRPKRMPESAGNVR